jgi:hypothetical protein
LAVGCALKIFSMKTIENSMLFPSLDIGSSGVCDFKLYEETGRFLSGRAPAALETKPEHRDRE